MAVQKYVNVVQTYSLAACRTCIILFWKATIEWLHLFCLCDHWNAGEFVVSVVNLKCVAVYLIVST